jgi:mannose-6-phosphate isomerase-like protein (cupin superfamily)
VPILELVAPVPARSRLSLAVLADVADGLAASHPSLPPWLVHPSTGRGSMRLLTTDVYDAWLLTWPPGSNVDPHDHGDSHGAFAVVTGELEEIRWRGRRRRTRLLRAGDVTTVPAGVVHDVVGVGSTLAVSVHAYSPPLREMRFYERA